MHSDQSQLQIANRKLQIHIPIVAGIGNALMAQPMVRELARLLPESQITVLAMIPPMAEPFKRLSGIDVVVTGKGSKNLLRGAMRSRKQQPDVYIVPFPSNRWQYNVLARAAGAKRVVIHGYDIGKWSALNVLHGNRIPAVRGIHDVVQNLRLLSALDLSPNESLAPVFPINDMDKSNAEALLQSIGLKDQYIIMHAGSAQTILAQAKRWPAEQYAKLARNIVELTGKRVLIVEGPDEAGVTTEILKHLTSVENIHTLTLRGGLGDTAALLARAQFYVGTDSGLAHLAAAVGKRAITLFAPADPDRVCPYGNRDLVVQPNKTCCPCFTYPWESTKPAMQCREPMCIREITVQQVMDKVQHLHKTGGV